MVQSAGGQIDAAAGQLATGELTEFVRAATCPPTPMNSARRSSWSFLATVPAHRYGRSVMWQQPS